MIDCALFEPEIPQNAGAVLRLGACFGVPIHVVHPCGFVLSDRNFKRAGLDYLSRAALTEHADRAAFTAWRRASDRRLVAFSSHAEESLLEFTFAPDDVILLGRESAGLPEALSLEADAVLRIPIRAGNRSLNLATAAAIGIFEALRQIGGLPYSRADPHPATAR
jgi:tRNA (cytidine/uridine-2'-O-)-methyltransferase